MVGKYSPTGPGRVLKSRLLAEEGENRHNDNHTTAVLSLCPAVMTLLRQKLIY